MRDPTIAIMVDGRSGEITGVHVLAHEARDRHDGYVVVQALRQQLETFQEELRERLRRLHTTQ